jgi:hypothetical protein
MPHDRDGDGPALTVLGWGRLWVYLLSQAATMAGQAGITMTSTRAYPRKSASWRISPKRSSPSKRSAGQTQGAGSHRWAFVDKRETKVSDLCAPRGRRAVHCPLSGVVLTLRYQLCQPEGETGDGGIGDNGTLAARSSAPFSCC